MLGLALRVDKRIAGGEKVRGHQVPRERLSPRERYYVSAHYYDTVTGEKLARAGRALWGTRVYVSAPVSVPAASIGAAAVENEVQPAAD